MLDKLKETKDLSGLAKLLGYQPKAVSYILYKIREEAKYTTFTIPKKDGGVREINAPVSHLKELQRRLADLLQRCFEEKYGFKNYRRPLSHGFRKDLSIITNASNHRNKRYVFNIDLKNFFPSINFGRVRGFFIKNIDFLLDPKVATIIAQISCHNNELPQGSPVSPIISNLIGHVLDIRLVKLAKNSRCSYSRYADDLTFSTREKEFPALIASNEPTSEWQPSKQLNGTIKRTGFEVNLKKISMQYHTRRQMTTGLVVNRIVNIPSSYYRQARAMCNALFRTGVFYIGKEMRWGTSKNSSEKKMGTLSQLRGVLSYIYNVRKRHDERDIKERWAKPTATHNLYRKFLYFEKFFFLNKPLVICEGKTDSVYIKCAIESLAPYYRKLIDTSSNKTEYLVDFFKYSKMNMDLMQFSGGTGDLASLINHYEIRLNSFLCTGKQFPVIILVDNDSGAKPVLKEAKKISGKNVDDSEQFHYILHNLYLVVLPKKPDSESVMIEDFFEPSVLHTLLEEKTFHPDDKTFKKEKHYGKQAFASNVITANKKTINFEGFRPVLDRLEAVIVDYEGRVPAH